LRKHPYRGLNGDNGNYNKEMEYHVLTEMTIKKATQMRGFFADYQQPIPRRTADTMRDMNTLESRQFQIPVVESLSAVIPAMLLSGNPGSLLDAR